MLSDLFAENTICGWKLSRWKWWCTSFVLFARGIL